MKFKHCRNSLRHLGRLGLAPIGKFCGNLQRAIETCYSHCYSKVDIYKFEVFFGVDHQSKYKRVKAEKENI